MIDVRGEGLPILYGRISSLGAELDFLYRPDVSPKRGGIKRGDYAREHQTTPFLTHSLGRHLHTIWRGRESLKFSNSAGTIYILKRDHLIHLLCTGLVCVRADNSLRSNSVAPFPPFTPKLRMHRMPAK